MTEITETNVAEATAPVVPVTLDDIKTKLMAAITGGDDAEVMRLSKAVTKFKSDIEKAEANRLAAEAVSLAGEREVIEGILLAAIMPMVKPEDLLKVKAKSFIFTVAHKEDANGKLDANGEVKVKAGLKLVVPTVKAKKSGGGGNGTGVTLSSTTGMARKDLIETYATDEEKAEVEAKVQTAADEGKNANQQNSIRWASNQPVVKRILEAHPELIKR